MLNQAFPGLVLQEILGGLTFNPALPEIFSHGSYIDLFRTNISVKGCILNNLIVNLLFLFQVRTKNYVHNSSKKSAVGPFSQLLVLSYGTSSSQPLFFLPTFLPKDTFFSLKKKFGSTKERKKNWGTKLTCFKKFFSFSIFLRFLTKG